MTNEEQIIALLTEIRDQQRADAAARREEKAKTEDWRKKAEEDAQVRLKGVDETRRLFEERQAIIASTGKAMHKTFKIERCVVIAILVLSAIGALGSVVFILTHF